MQAYLKKLDALELDINNYSHTVGELAAVSQDLVNQHHYDSQNISKAQVTWQFGADK